MIPGFLHGPEVSGPEVIGGASHGHLAKLQAQGNDRFNTGCPANAFFMHIFKYSYAMFLSKKLTFTC
jgi:hypothetical protein